MQTDEKANNTSKRLQSHCVSYNFYFGLGLAVIDICSFNLRIVYVTVMPEGEKVWGGAVLMDGDNLPSPVGIGLTDQQNIGGPVAPLAPSAPPSLYRHT